MSFFVLLLRHGKTAGNLEHRYIGRTDQPLCPQGIAELHPVKAAPSVSRIHVSSMKRTQETAAILFPGIPQQTHEGLREMDFGSFEQRTPDEMREDADYRRWVAGFCMDPCPNGESMAQVSERSCNAFFRMLHEELQKGAPGMILVAHGGTLMALMERCSGETGHFSRWLTENGGGWLAHLQPETWDADPHFLDYTRITSADLPQLKL